MAAKKTAKRTAKRPTTEEIQAQIKALSDIKPKVRRRSTFGDDHWDAIEAQIAVLDTLMTDQQIDDASSFEDDEEENEDGWKTNVRDAAIDARKWLDGKYTDAADLVAGWQDLVQE